MAFFGWWKKGFVKNLFHLPKLDIMWCGNVASDGAFYQSSELCPK